MIDTKQMIRRRGGEMDCFPLSGPPVLRRIGMEEGQVLFPLLWNATLRSANILRHIAVHCYAYMDIHTDLLYSPT